MADVSIDIKSSKVKLYQSYSDKMSVRDKVALRFRAMSHCQRQHTSPPRRMKCTNAKEVAHTDVCLSCCRENQARCNSFILTLCSVSSSSSSGSKASAQTIEKKKVHQNNNIKQSKFISSGFIICILISYRVKKKITFSYVVMMSET